MTIIEFLNARLDEDEAYARFAFADHNQAEPTWHEVRSGAVSLGDHEDELLTFDAGTSRHIARHDPARVLAEVAAMRHLVDAHHPIDPCDAHDPVTMESEPCDTLLHLAAVHADHPDYDQEWRL
jgi:hypothetical protein